MRQILFWQRFFQGIRCPAFSLGGTGALIGLVLWLIVWVPDHAWAIEQHPSQSQILEAVEKGREGAKHGKPPNMLYWRFGSSENDSRPYGFLMTKLSGIAVLSSHFALRGEQPTSLEIQKVLDEKVLQVVVMIFGDSSTFAKDSYLLLEQGNRVIKPDRIRFDARASPVTQRQGEQVFRAKIVAFFVYGTFDLKALTTIKVFPGAGGELAFHLDFSAIP